MIWYCITKHRPMPQSVSQFHHFRTQYMYTTLWHIIPRTKDLFLCLLQFPLLIGHHHFTLCSNFDTFLKCSLQFDNPVFFLLNYTLKTIHKRNKTKTVNWKTLERKTKPVLYSITINEFKQNIVKPWKQVVHNKMWVGTMATDHTQVTEVHKIQPIKYQQKRGREKKKGDL